MDNFVMNGWKEKKGKEHATCIKENERKHKKETRKKETKKAVSFSLFELHINFRGLFHAEAFLEDEL